MDEYIFVSIFIIVIGSLIVKQRESLREIIEEFVATQQETEDVVEVEEIRDMIFDFVVKNSEKFSKCKYNEPTGQSGIEKMS
tara:strand:- start:26 stop:271 length:246 start_codon:yes stop_codon:yes gene_type:complete